MKITSDSILRPQWLAYYDTESAKTSFDVECPPCGTYRPIRQLGYHTFQIRSFAPGLVRYNSSFTMAARRAFPAR